MEQNIKLNGKYSAQIMDVLNAHKVIRHSVLMRMLHCNVAWAYSRNKLIEMGLIERHGQYLCLPDYANEVPKNQQNKAPKIHQNKHKGDNSPDTIDKGFISSLRWMDK